MRVHQHSKEGFTLIELLIVVAILGILSAVAIPQFRDYQARTKENAVRANHKQVVNLLSGEFAKCSAGETTAQIGTQTALTCSTATVSNFATTVAAYFAAEGVTSPYDSGTSAVSAAAAGTTQGLTYVTATDATNTIVVTSVPVTGSTQVSTIVRE